MKHAVMSHALRLLLLVVAVYPLAHSRALASRVYVLSPEIMALSYLSADLVVVGNVVRIEQEILDMHDRQSDNGWTYNYIRMRDMYRVVVGRILKGEVSDSLLTIYGQPFGGEPYKYRLHFWQVTERGDSMWRREVHAIDGAVDQGLDKIAVPGRHIILVELQDSEYVSLLAHVFEESKLEFYEAVEAEGEAYLKRFESPRPQ